MRIGSYDLSEKDIHCESYATTAHNGYPAKRLSIRLGYKLKEVSETKKLSSFVEFLDGDSEEYTEK